MAPFHAMAELKQKRAVKELNVSNVNTKGSPLNRQKSQTENSSIFNGQNDHYLCTAINFDYVSPPPPYTF